MEAISTLITHKPFKSLKEARAFASWVVFYIREASDAVKAIAEPELRDELAGEDPQQQGKGLIPFFAWGSG